VQRLQELQSFEKVYAPFDGVITARNTDVGYLINSGAGAPQQALFRMASLGKLRVYINVPQQYSPSATPGLMAYLSLPQFPGRRFPGTLVRTSNSIDLTSRTLLVEVDVDNPKGELLPGAYTEVHLKLPETSSSYIVPVSALIFQQSGMRVAEVGPNNHVIMHPMTIGRDFGTEVEVVSGLTGKEKIIDSPPDSLLDGQTVRVAPEPTGGNVQ
jgi:RND family efflux transporter MFP subunit